MQFANRREGDYVLAGAATPIARGLAVFFLYGLARSLLIEGSEGSCSHHPTQVSESASEGRESESAPSPNASE